MSRAAQGASGEVVLYRSPDGQIRLDVRLARDSVWLTQAQMAKLFKRDQSVISRHVRNVFSEGELPAGGQYAKSAYCLLGQADRPLRPRRHHPRRRRRMSRGVTDSLAMAP
jgi:hypothetical protein